MMAEDADNVIRLARAGAAAAKQARVENPRIFFASDLGDELPPIPWCVEGLELAPGLPTVFGGYGYSGKSIAAQSMLFSIAAGSLVWGKFSAQTGRCLHLDYEQGKRLTQERYQRLARGLGMNLTELGDRLAVWPLPELDLAKEDSLDELAKRVEGFSVCLIDSMRASMIGLDENDSRSAQALYGLGRVSEKTGTTMVLIHHAVKTSQNGTNDERMMLRGSGAIYGACQSVWHFTGGKSDEEGGKPRPIEVVNTKARLTGRNFERVQLEIHDLANDDHPNWGVVVSAGEKPKPQGLEPKIISALMQYPEGLSGKGIRDIVGGKAEKVHETVNVLVDKRVVSRLVNKGRGGGFTYVLTSSLAGEDWDRSL